MKNTALYDDFADSFRLALRIAALVVALSVGVVAIIAGARNATAATLRSESVIAGDYIRLGDIFEGVTNADYVLGPAPLPGKDMILNARTLYKIASALDVDWRPATSAEQLVLRREAIVVPQSQITAAIQDKIRASGVDNNFSVEYSSGAQDMILPAGSKPTLDITAFTYDAQNDTFNAVVVAPSADKPVKRATLVGRIERLVSVPVLKNSLRSGDVIGALDIDYIELPRHKIAAGTLLEEKDLVDMTPRRVVLSGKPVALSDLERPKMVERGDAVTLIFANGPMQLTVKGKSLQGGAIGDTVRVSNLDSNKNLQGTITAHREVTIR